MIQIIGLRKFFDNKDLDKSGIPKEKTRQKGFGQFPSHIELFKNITNIIETIPESERWNLYYTTSDCKDREQAKAFRRFDSMPTVPFDLDGIDVEKLETYTQLFFKTFPIQYESTLTICSGNGLQFLVLLDEPLTDKSCFDQWRLRYQFICKRFDEVLRQNDLPGNMDPVVWSDARLFRMPYTENRKKDKGIKQATMIQGNLAPQPFDWVKMSGVEEIPKSEQITDWSTDQTRVDHKEVYAKCDFIRTTRDSPELLREPHYYAALTIIARMDNGLQRAFNLRDAIRGSGSDSSVSSYSDDAVETKVQQALSLTGPRTCKSIAGIHKGCELCPLKAKTRSPITIKGKTFIATEKNGFTYVGPRGGVTYIHHDLVKYMERELKFKTLSNGLVWVWKGQHYRATTPTNLRNFALKHFRPTPTQTKVLAEFKGFVENQNVVDDGFFNSPKLNGKLNCSNGVVDLMTGDLKPHDPALPFQYILPYDYDPKAVAPLWESFVNDIMDSDKALVNLLQEFAGYAISGDEYKHHKFLMLTGTGRNGKGTFMSVLTKLAGGAKNVSSVSFADIQKNENNRQLLEGKLFNFADETNTNEFRNTSLLKKMTGEGEILVKLMYNQPYSIESRTKLIFSCNEMPELNDTTHAFKQRMIAVPFNKSYTADAGNVDIHIKKKLLEELPGILNWCVEGFRRLQKQGHFSNAASSQTFAENYFASNNPVEHWVEECSTLVVRPLNGKNTWVAVDDVFKKYSDWAMGKGREYELSYINFCRKFRALMPDHNQRLGRKHLVQGKARGYFDLTLGDDTYAQDEGGNWSRTRSIWSKETSGPRSGPSQSVDFI